MSSATHYRLVCPYCNEKTQSGHMVPASLGDPNTLICEAINRLEQERGMAKAKDWLTPVPATPAPTRPEPRVPYLECDECAELRSASSGVLGEIHGCPRRGAFRLVHYPSSVVDAPVAPVPEDREEATKAACFLGTERIACGHSSPNAEVERRFVALRAANGFADDGTGCGRAGVWTVMYRCVECARFFHRDCILKHFAEHTPSDYSAYRASVPARGHTEGANGR